MARPVPPLGNGMGATSPALLVSEQLAHPNLWLQAVTWPTLALLLTLWFLPRIKGCIMGLMWALGMRGHEVQ